MSAQEVLEAEISLYDIFATVAYEPHPAQDAIHQSDARHRVAACGRRFGKSQIGGHELTSEAFVAKTIRRYLEETAQRYDIWIVGPEYTDAEKEFRVLWNDAKRLELPFDRPGTYYNAEAGDMVMSLWGGKFIVHGKSAKYPSTLVGEGLRGVIMAEAAKLKPSVWTKYVRPTLADFRGWSLHTSTPEGKNWFYDNWRRGQDPNDTAWASWRFPSYANPVVFPLGKDDPEVADMRADMSEAMAAQEIDADFNDFVGRVFKSFDEEIHVRDLAYNPKLPLYGACDYGWSNPFVWLAIQIDVWDNVYVIGEYRTTHRDTGDIAQDLAAWPLARNAIKFFPDPAEPEDTAQISKVIKVQANTNTGGPKKIRLEYIRNGLKLMPEHLPDGDPQKQPRLFIDRRCTGLIWEMNEYRYPENKSEIRPDPEDPLDKDDHGPEALGRFYRGYFGTPAGPTSGGRGKVTRAKVSGGRQVR